MELSADELGTLRSPFDDLLGIRVVAASGQRVVSEVTVTERLTQPSGIVHGGLYATMIEGAAGMGAALWANEHVGAFAVGVSNTTDFLRAVSEGQLRLEATPIQQGRTLQLWEGTITDEQGRVIAHGKVRLINRDVGKRPGQG